MTAMMNVKVSVIIPVYNAEQYVQRCIDSALHQTLREIEIIVVNDGSTDRTAQLCNSYDDKRITVINSENNGPATARNQGIDAASGDYIGFMDSDSFKDSISCHAP